MTDQDSRLCSSLIVGNITESEEMPYNLQHSTKTLFPPKHSRKILRLMKYWQEFHSLLREENETFLVSYIRL
jgi:hypothetical protein